MSRTSPILAARGATPAAPRDRLTLVPRRWPTVLSLAASAVAAVAAAWTWLDPGLLRGPAVMNGSARGTALVMLVLTVPISLVGLVGARAGSRRAVVLWLGALASLLYQAFLLVFATPFNAAFLLYVGLLAVAAWAVATAMHDLDVEDFGVGGGPLRGIAVYVWVVAALNAAAWLRQIAPALGSSGEPAFLTGTGMTTNAVFVEDLAVWLPLAAVGAAWLWRRRPVGVLVVGSLLAMWFIESVSVSVDQWMGHHADPASAVASDTMVVPFALLALVSLIPLAVMLRALSGGRPRTSGHP